MTEKSRLRILILWGAAHYDGLLKDCFLEGPQHDYELVSGHRSKTKSPHFASLGRLFSLRKRLARGEFDLVICSPVQNTPFLPKYRNFFTRLAHALRFLTVKRGMLDSWWTPWLLNRKGGGKTPLAVIDFHDTSFVLPQDHPLLEAATLYYKLNLYFWPRRSLMSLEHLMGRKPVTPLTPKLRPMTNGVTRRAVPASVPPIAGREYDIFFSARTTPHRSEGDTDPFVEFTFNPIRRDIYERCVALKSKYNVYVLDGGLPWDEYLAMLQRSKLVICPESFGCETFRHNETAAAGAVPVINWMYATNYLPFEPDIHAIYFSLIGGDFERTIDRALADPAKLEQIAINARELAVNFKQRQTVGEHIIAETLAAAKTGAK